MSVTSTRPRRRPGLRVGLLALAVAVPWSVTGGPAQAAPGAVSSAPAAESAKLRPTAFALASRGFGTRVTGGEIPVESGTTAFQRLACTNKAGITRQISEAELDVPGLGVVSGVRTVIRTTQRRGTVASTAVQRVASVVLADSPLGSLSIEGLRAKARTFHDRDGFHATASSDVARLVLTPPVGEPQVLPLPSANQPVTIPGLAEITLGDRTTKQGPRGARAQASALVVEVIPSDTRAVIGLARTKINSGVEDLVYRGSSSGIRAQGLDGVLTKGRTPLSLMPCQGTGGKVQGKDVAALDLTGAIEVGALSSEQRTWRTKRATRAYERGSVAGLDLGDGALVVDAVVAKANLVKPRNGRARFNTKGTTVGSITADGEEMEFPDTGVLEIPGLARLEAAVTKRRKQAISVVGLRITLLDGTGAVIDLGTATVGGKRSGR